MPWRTSLANFIDALASASVSMLLVGSSLLHGPDSTGHRFTADVGFPASPSHLWHLRRRGLELFAPVVQKQEVPSLHQPSQRQRSSARPLVQDVHASSAEVAVEDLPGFG